MIDEIIKFIDKYDLRNKKIIVGFSGGYDSVCLLDNLIKIKDVCALVLIGAHYNHNWRGDKAKIEQLACEKYCKEKDIEFYTETADCDVKKTETVARELRYEFFERALKKYNADAVFTAHNYNDNAETLLYRLAKGTGIVGLNGILPKRGYYYRPMLEIERKDIEQYCRINNLIPNNDESNSDTVHKRNLIRNEILPLMTEINPEVVSAINTLSKIAQTENKIVDEYMTSVEKRIYDGNKIKTELFRELSHHTKIKVIYNLIYKSKIDYNYSLIERIVDFIENTVKSNKPSKYSVGDKIWVYADKNIIELIENESFKTNEELKISAMGEYRFLNYIFTVEETDTFGKTQDECDAYVDLTKYKNGELTIRTRRSGDIIQPLGSVGKMKLKKYLMSKNVPQHERDGLLLVCNDREVLWVAGVGLSDKIKTISRPTHYFKITKNED